MAAFISSYNRSNHCVGKAFAARKRRVLVRVGSNAEEMPKGISSTDDSRSEFPFRIEQERPLSSCRCAPVSWNRNALVIAFLCVHPVLC